MNNRNKHMQTKDDFQTNIPMQHALIQAQRRLSEDLNPQELPGRILEQLAFVVPYERGALMLQDGPILRITAQRGFPSDERIDNLVMPARPGDIYEEMFKTVSPELIDDVTQDARWMQVDWLPLNRSWLGVPLFAKNRVVGMVSLTRVEAGAFSQADILMATAFAMQAAVALENAALYQEITLFNQRLEQTVLERTEELRRALDTLARMDRNKSDFINVAAHELRTPLTVMKGYIGMMKRDAAVTANPGLSQTLNGIEKGTDRLHDVVNNMLDLARIDNQVLDFKPEIVTAISLLRRVHLDYTRFLTDRQITLQLDGLESLPSVQGDPGLLLKVFQSVVINAIKYTPDGGLIKIYGRPVQDARLGRCVEICIQDNGIGIDEGQLELIFEKLYTTNQVALHSSGKATFKGGGPGLGLTIARGIIQAHQGRIWAESPGHDETIFPGSTFHILLPT